jgi:hypothetical protein
MNRTVVFSLWCALVCLPTFAATERLNDSSSPRNRVTSSLMMSEQGLPLDQNALAPSAKVGIVKFSRIEYKLATAKFIGKQARIYYVVPPLISGLRTPSGLRVDWRGGNVFANGSAQPGERFLVWTGVVRNTYMIDGLDLTMRIDLRELQTRNGAGLAFESYFEIEVFE